jgi:hypothetical protein
MSAVKTGESGYATITVIKFENYHNTKQASELVSSYLKIVSQNYYLWLVYV